MDNAAREEAIGRFVRTRHVGIVSLEHMDWLRRRVANAEAALLAAQVRWVAFTDAILAEDYVRALDLMEEDRKDATDGQEAET